MTNLHILWGDISHTAILQSPCSPPLRTISVTVINFKFIAFIKTKNVFRAFPLGGFKCRHCKIYLHSNRSTRHSVHMLNEQFPCAVSVYDNNVDHGVIPLVDAISRAAFRRNISGHANVQLLVELQTSTVLLEVCVKCSLLRYGDQLSSIVELLSMAARPVPLSLLLVMYFQIDQWRKTQQKGDNPITFYNKMTSLFFFKEIKNRYAFCVIILGQMKKEERTTVSRIL